MSEQIDEGLRSELQRQGVWVTSMQELYKISAFVCGRVVTLKGVRVTRAPPAPSENYVILQRTTMNTTENLRIVLSFRPLFGLISAILPMKRGGGGNRTRE